MIFTKELADEYASLFCSLEIDQKKALEISILATKILFNKTTYEQVEKVTKVPFYVIGLIHCMEADFNFKTHLHNGDTLEFRTTHEPRWRPVNGSPPFTWEASAIDALQFDHLDEWTEWTIAGICYKLEAYNGWGYRSHHIHSPYLWSGCQHYTKGKFASDGVYDSDIVSSQIGAAVILKFLTDHHNVSLKAYKNA